MSLKKVRQVKADKGFKIWDLAVYGAVAIVAVVIFLAVFLTRDSSPLEGVRVYSRGTPVFEYVFGKDEYKILGDGAAEVVVTDGDGELTVRVTTDDGYNVISVNKSGGVKVTEADCKNKDCVYIPEITDNGGIIFCSPHGLRVVPFDYDPDDGIIIV